MMRQRLEAEDALQAQLTALEARAAEAVAHGNYRLTLHSASGTRHTAPYALTRAPTPTLGRRGARRTARRRKRRQKPKRPRR